MSQKKNRERQRAMSDNDATQEIKEAKDQYERWAPPDPQAEYKTAFGLPVNRIYTPADIEGTDYLRDIGFPGQFPLTRGVHAGGYRTRLWNFRQSAEDRGAAPRANRYWKKLIEEGTGINAFQIANAPRSGMDSDDEMFKGIVTQIHLDTIVDYEDLIDGIDLDKFNLHLATESPHDLAFFVAAAEKKGWERKNLRGGISNKVRMVLYPEQKGNPSIDIVEFCAKEMPRFHSFCIDSRCLREAGANAVQEIAFGVAIGIGGIRACLERGLALEQFGSRIQLVSSSDNEFLEEVAKFRAYRRMWARTMREQFGVEDPNLCRPRMHVQTSGASLEAQQPFVNIARGAFYGLAAVLGGAQSMSITPFDEPFAAPTEFSTTVSLRTQQVIAHETGVAKVIDPLAGSYYIEWLTNKMEEEAQQIFETIEKKGGAFKAAAWMVAQMEETAWKHHKAMENKERIVVGVNEFTIDEEKEKEWFSPPMMDFDPRLEEELVERLNKVRRDRDNSKVEQAKEMLYKAYKTKENIVPHIIEAAKAYVTIGEVGKVRAAALGEAYRSGVAHPLEVALFGYY